MREYIVASGRIVPATAVVRGPLLVGDQESWFRSIRASSRSVILRQVAFMDGVLLAIPVLMALMGAPAGLILALSGPFLGLFLLFVPLMYVSWVAPMVSGYQRLGLSPTPTAWSCPASS